MTTRQDTGEEPVATGEVAAGEANTWTDLAVGDVVEWDTFIGVDRGVVSAVTETRVYVRTQRTNQRGRRVTRDCEFWWDARDVNELRLIERPGDPYKSGAR